MNTVQLECFLTVAEYPNFSKASEALKLTQPAVTHQIQSLEKELNVKLFRRTSKNVSLTQEGLLFISDAQLILKTAMSAKERLGNHEHFVSLEIGCHNQIESNQIHAALGLKETHRRPSLFYQELCLAPAACVCAPGHPLSRHRTLTTKQLASAGNFIACTPRPVPDSFFHVQNSLLMQLPPKNRFLTDSVDSAFALAKAQIGYTLYPDIPAARDAELCYIPITDLSAISFGVYCPPEHDLPVLKRFLALMGKALQTQS